MISLGIDVGGSSVKVAGLVDGRVAWTGQSSRYADPSADDLAKAISEAIGGRAADARAVGLCVPGLLDEAKSKIVLAVNLPRLNGIALRDIVYSALGHESGHDRVAVLNDTTAAAYDLYLGRELSGRLFLMALGTGVGACVMDQATPLRVDGDSPGHFGQIDVSIEGHPVIGPDGGAGGLEGHVGAAALAATYGLAALERMTIADAAGQALTRAIRIAHALYRPHHVILAGGVGIRLGHLLPDLQRAVNTKLTSIARQGWTLTVGDSDFHNAAGAARAAAL
jgi:predicted NBD/HSP70 family sugar kinase